MVGVPKSTGCAICRKRKIKCDETWPNCINCRKNGKCCPGPPSRHTFKEAKPRLNLNGVSSGVGKTVFCPGVCTKRKCLLFKIVDVNDLLYDKEPFPLPKRRSNDGTVNHKSKINQRLKKHQRSAESRSSQASSMPGSLGQSLPCPSSNATLVSKQHQLARKLIEALESRGIMFGLSRLGGFICEVPARVSHSVALDTAVDCLVQAHFSSTSQSDACEIINPRLYMRAVQALHKSLEDPDQVLLPNTLCASVLLGVIEAIAGPKEGTRYLTHIRGVRRLAELQGPTNYLRDGFLKSILQFSRGGIIITSIYDRKHCFLASPEWHDAAFSKSKLRTESTSQAELMRLASEIPELLCGIKDLNEIEAGQGANLLRERQEVPYIDTEAALDMISPIMYQEYPNMSAFLPPPQKVVVANASLCTRSLRSDLLSKVHHFKRVLQDASATVNARESNWSFNVERPVFETGSPTPATHLIIDKQDATTGNLRDALLLITNKLLLELLPPNEPLAYAIEAESRTTAHHICMVFQPALNNRILGGFDASLSFVMAYEYCTPDVQRCMLKEMTALPNIKFQWSHTLMHRMIWKLCL